MNAQRAGSNRLVEARLAAYAAAMKDGKSSAEALAIAKAVTRKQAVAAAKTAGRPIR